MNKRLVHLASWPAVISNIVTSMTVWFVLSFADWRCSWRGWAGAASLAQRADPDRISQSEGDLMFLRECFIGLHPFWHASSVLLDPQLVSPWARKWQQTQATTCKRSQAVWAKGRVLVARVPAGPSSFPMNTDSSRV